jgi:hypothetical protein
VKILFFASDLSVSLIVPHKERITNCPEFEILLDRKSASAEQLMRLPLLKTS